MGPVAVQTSLRFIIDSIASVHIPLPEQGAFLERLRFT